MLDLISLSSLARRVSVKVAFAAAMRLPVSGSLCLLSSSVGVAGLDASGGGVSSFSGGGAAFGGGTLACTLATGVAVQTGVAVAEELAEEVDPSSWRKLLCRNHWWSCSWIRGVNIIGVIWPRLSWQSSIV